MSVASRSGLRSLASICAATLALSAFTASSTASATAPGAYDQGVYIVLTGDDSFADGIIKAAGTSPEYRAKIQALVPTWLKAARSGQALGATSLDGRQDASRDVAELEEVQAWLLNPTSTQPTGVQSTSTQPATPAPAATTQARSIPATSVPPTSAQNTGAPAAAKPPAVTTQAQYGTFVDPNNPNSFQVRGAAVGDRTYWADLRTAIAVVSCQGSCRETDRITARATVSPGADTSQISVTTVYSPNAGNLNSFVDLQFKSINRGNVTGTGFAAQRPGSATWIHGNGRNLNGTVLTISVALGTEIYTPPFYGAQRWDGAKTADATCNKTNNRCRY